MTWDFTDPQAGSLHLVASLFLSFPTSPILDLGRDRLPHRSVAQLFPRSFHFKNETTLRPSQSAKALSRAQPPSELDLCLRPPSPLSYRLPMFSLRGHPTKCIRPLLSLLQLPLVPFARTPLHLPPHQTSDYLSRPSQLEHPVLAKRVPTQVIVLNVPLLLLPICHFLLLPLDLLQSRLLARSPSDHGRSFFNRQKHQRDDFR